MKKLKSRKSLLINSLDNFNENNDTRAADLNYLKEKEFQELQKRFFALEDLIAQYFDHILSTSIKEIENKTVNARGYTFVDEMRELTKNKMLEPETLFNYIKEIIQRIINYKNENLEKLKKREINVEGSYDEVLTNLETDVRNYIKENTKLKLYIDTASMRMNDLNSIIRQKDNEYLKSQEEIKSLLKEMESIKKFNDDEKTNLMKKIELDDIMIRKMEQQLLDLRRNSSDGFVKRASFRMAPGTAPLQSHARSSLLLTNKEYVSLFENLTGKGSKNLKDPNANILSHKLIQAYQKNQKHATSTDYKIARLKIQVNQKTKETYKMDLRNKELYNELKKAKDEQKEEEKKKWSKEINSDSNQNSVNYYKQKIEEKEKTIQELEKKVKKFAFLEKKIFVKEKAFEIERADYHDKLLYLNERVSK